MDREVNELPDAGTLCSIGEKPPTPPSPPPPESEEAAFPHWEDDGEGGAAEIGATEVGDSQLVSSPSARLPPLTREEEAEEEEEEEEEASAFEPPAPGDAAAGEEAGQMGADMAEHAAEAASQGGGKRKRGRPPKSQGGGRAPPAKRKEEEEVCFICFDGGNLVVCDRRGCSKVYHPACVNRDDAFFRTRGRWNCGWHICSICEKAAHYMCYTCTYSLCKGCIQEANFFCVRGSKGFCETCYSTVRLIESNENGNEAGVDFNNRNSWEYLFKEYWLDQKRKLVLTLEELKNAKNPLKGSGVSAYNDESSDELYNADDDQEYSSESLSGHRDGSTSSRKKVRRHSRNTVDDESSAKEIYDESTSMPEEPEWASQELLEFVAHMKNGDKSVLSQFDVQALLLEYIKLNNLRDPRKKSQIVCDPRLQNLFGKARVGHFEMLKLLESHFLTKEASQTDADDDQVANMDPDSVQMDAEGYSSTTAKMSLDKRRKSRKKIEEREPQTNLDDYAAIDVHNINLIYLRRNLMEDLIDDDVDTFNEKVVGSFVRIKIPGTGQRQDIYRLVQVVGTQMFAEKYKIGKKTTDIALQILNLDKTEVVTIDIISNQEFTEEECKRLRQSIKCGLIRCLTVGDVLKKARVLQAVRVDDWLESEKLRLSHLRDRASETGRRKELRECVEKLQTLNSPEERMRRLNEVPEIHADPHMDPDYESADEEVDDKTGDKYSRSRESLSRRKGRDLFSPGKGSESHCNWNGASKSSSSSRVLTEGGQDKLDAYSGGGDRTNELSLNQGKDTQQTNTWGMPNTQTSVIGLEAGIWKNNQLVTKPGNTYGVAPETTSTSVLSRLSEPLNINENDKVWHYQDPAGIVQGPFSMVQLRKWNKFFPPDLRIWLTTEKQENSILLTDVLKSHNGFPLQGPQHDSYPQPTNFAGPMGNRDNEYEGGWKGTNNSTWVGMQNGGNWSANQNNATFSTVGNTLTNAGRWAAQSANLSATEMEVVKGSNAWFGQPNGQNSPRATAPFSGNLYQQPSYQGGGRQGNADQWNIGQDPGSAWNSDSPRRSWTSGQGYERHHSSWSSLSQQSQQTSGEPWKARPASDSNLPVPSPQPSRRDWTRVQGSLHLSASTTACIQPVSSGWGTTSGTGFSGAHRLSAANPVEGSNVTKQSEGQDSWSFVSASVPTMSGLADVAAAQIPERADHLGDPRLCSRQKPSESNAPNMLVSQPALFLKKEETISSNDGTVLDGSAMSKSQSFESDYPSPTPRRGMPDSPVVQPNEPDRAKKWPQAHDSSASDGQGSDPASALAFRPLDPHAHLLPKVDMKLLSRDSDEDVADKGIISEMQNLVTQKSSSAEQNKQPPGTGMEEKLVDPASTIKPSAESGVLELASAQRSEALSAPKPVSEHYGWAPASACKQETSGSSIIPASPPREVHFSGPEPMKSSNLDGPQDTSGSEWSLPSPTPGSRPSGWDIGADSTSGSSVDLAGLSKPGWGTMANDVPSWGEPKFDVATGPAQGSENRGWATAIQGNANTGGATAQGNTDANTGWGTLGQVSSIALTDWGAQAHGSTNANFGCGAPAQGNLMSPSFGASIQANPNPNPNPNPNTGWGATAQGNLNQYSSWGAPPTGNANQNIGWGAQTQQVNTDEIASWGTGTNRSWNSPARDPPDSWSTQRKHHGDNYSEGRESGYGGGRSSWNRTHSARGGGSSRPPPRGQGQRGVCRFYESGHCKKGASCNYLHP